MAPRARPPKRTARMDAAVDAMAAQVVKAKMRELLEWSYAIFWKIGCQNPKLLIWEECYCEPVIYSNGQHGVQATNKVHLLVTKMTKDNYINLLGEGLVGRVAFSRNHQWIIFDNKKLVHPPEVANEVYTQFSTGIQPWLFTEIKEQRD